MSSRSPSGRVPSQQLLARAIASHVAKSVPPSGAWCRPELWGRRDQPRSLAALTETKICLTGDYALHGRGRSGAVSSGMRPTDEREPKLAKDSPDRLDRAEIRTRLPHDDFHINCGNPVDKTDVTAPSRGFDRCFSGLHYAGAAEMALRVVCSFKTLNQLEISLAQGSVDSHAVWPSFETFVINLVITTERNASSAVTLRARRGTPWRIWT
jgi:hypothetical protein